MSERARASKKIENESVVYRQTALVLRYISMADTTQRLQQTKVGRQDKETGQGQMQRSRQRKHWELLGWRVLLLTLAIFLQDS